LFPTNNLTQLAAALVDLKKSGTHLVTAKELQNLKFSPEELTSLIHPDYILIAVIIIGIAIVGFISYKIYKRCTYEHPHPLDEALAHLDRQERLEYLELKNQTARYKRDLDIIKLGDRAPSNMADYTVDKPTPPIDMKIYPNIARPLEPVY
jgi:hypothetical protein